MKKCILFCLTCGSLLSAGEPSEAKLKTLYNSLDPLSISQHLAYYELYSSSSWGQKALGDAFQLLTKRPLQQEMVASLSSLIYLVNKPIDQEMPSLDPASLKMAEQFSKRLPHIALKGHHVWDEGALLRLPLEEIDLARAIFINQFGNDRDKILTYEAFIDLMALQILPRLAPSALPEDKIIAINRFIFDEMGFRFPPHSLFAKNIDQYTFLPSVLDSRRGVCLGVSILYLCLAQRLNLPLEMITPPGHIYVRYRSKDKIINIETTARGIHLDCDDYLSVTTCSLQTRNMREVIGMSHFNQASIFWQNVDYGKALEAYRRAEPYMKGDPILTELMGYILLLTGEKEEGEKNILKVKDYVPDYALLKNTMAEDYFLGHVDPEGIGLIFTKNEEDRASVLEKKDRLEKLLKKYPKFRAGILSLAMCWVELHRMREALETLKSFESIDPTDPEVHYYLAILHAQRYSYPQAWHHLHQAEALVKVHGYNPKPLKELRRELLHHCPE
jgi:tetratricopeptide (TPR) repeat protein